MKISFAVFLLLLALASTARAFETQCARSGLDTEPIPFTVPAPSFTPKLISVSGVIEVVSTKPSPNGGIGASVLLYIDDRYVNFTEVFKFGMRKKEAFVVPFAFTHGVKIPGEIYTIDLLHFGPIEATKVFNLEVCFLGD